eukprot:Sspe_Gene.6177::Locus_2070_Transcript_1_4_Confidence_0.333_Length_3094::g.6177::m.6177
MPSDDRGRVPGDKAGCVWDDVTAKCERKKCQHPDQPTCSADTQCEWAAAMKKCIEKACNDPSETACKKHEFDCDWNGATCVPKECVSYADEKTCAEAPEGCEWKDDPLACALPEEGVQQVREGGRVRDEGVDEGLPVGHGEGEVRQGGGDLQKESGRQVRLPSVEGCAYKSGEGCVAAQFANCPDMDFGGGVRRVVVDVGGVRAAPARV